MCSEKRARNNMLSGLSRSVGMCLMPLIFWAVPRWKTFMWITSLPVVAFLCFPYYMIESPRWLATNGKWKRCAQFLQRIANVNGKRVEITAEYLSARLPPRTKENVYGMASFFSSLRLARNTMLIVTCWYVTAWIYAKVF